jgi:hypothetical protein
LKNEQPFGAKVPVLWDFGKVLWDSVSEIRAYDVDLADWQRQRTRVLSSLGQHLRVARAA